VLSMYLFIFLWHREISGAGIQAWPCDTESSLFFVVVVFYTLILMRTYGSTRMFNIALS
jgi:hypothetical protein